MHKTLIFVDLYTETENIGDIVISRLMVKELQKYGLVIFATESISNETVLRLELKKENIWLIPNWLFKIFLPPLLFFRLLFGKTTFRFFKPGHIFSATAKSFRLIHYLMALMKAQLQQCLGLKLCYVGSSVGPLNEMEERLEAMRKPRFHYYSVREDYSKSYLQGLGVTAIDFCPDMSWLLPPISNESRHRSLAILSFRQSILGSIDKTYDTDDKFLPSVLGIARYLQDRCGLTILISCQVGRDRDFCVGIECFLRKNGIRVAGVNEIHDESNARLLYQKASFVVSNRLHVILLAYSAGAIPLALVKKGHSKIIGVLERAGLHDAMLFIDEFSPEEVKAWAVRIRAASHLQETYREKFRENRQRIESEFQKIFATQAVQSTHEQSR